MADDPNGVVSCSASMPTGLIVGLTVGGLLFASLIALGFYQAYKGIRPVYSQRGTNVYL